MVQDGHIINKVDIPAVWAVVFMEKFFALPWPGIAAFLAALYTLVRLVDLVVKKIREWRRK